MRDLSIYIHIPFCVRKCLYCDFLSFPLSGEGGYGGTDRVKSYVNLLCHEICEAAAEYKGYRVVSVFFGGGTPSLLPAGETAAVMEEIRTHYRLAEDAEVTIEMNPGTADERKLKEYITCGINRLSIGLQSADDGELRRIGRIHDYETFLRTYEAARRAGFYNVNIDLMAALPEQSTASYISSLERVIALGPEHISAYSLILEEGTPLYEQQAQYHFPTEEEEREMYGRTKSVLAAAGYQRYEISNYARAGFACRHNKVYWQRGDYVGFGLGASSMVRNVRWTNPKEPALYRAYVEGLEKKRRTGRQHEGAAGGRTEGGFASGSEAESTLAEGYFASGSEAESVLTEGYFASGSRAESVLTEADFVPVRQVLTQQEQMEEYMFLGLRMMCGVDEEHFLQEFKVPLASVYGDILDRLCRQNLIVHKQGRITLTDFGIDVSNYVMAQFLFD